MAKAGNKHAIAEARKMPSWFFPGALAIDYPTAIEADVSKQNVSMAARRYYIDARFECEDCQREFVWTAKEQQFWFERLGFYVDSHAARCRSCRSKQRRIKRLQQEYDEMVGAARGSGKTNDMIRVIGIVDYLESLEAPLSRKMLATRKEFYSRSYEDKRRSKAREGGRTHRRQ